jgi:hypothetical protein
MKAPQSALLVSCLVLSANAAVAATTYYVATSNGNNNNAGTTMAAPFKTISKGAMAAQPGDTVYIMRGTYSGEFINLPRSGTSDAWITFSAYPGELPILEGNGSAATGFGSASAQYIRVVGLAAHNWGSGFGNGWTDSNCTTVSNGNWQFVNDIADGNGINGITFYCASNILIDQSIVGHNGAGDPNKSWSSGVNLFHVFGDATTNIVRRTTRTAADSSWTSAAPARCSRTTSGSTTAARASASTRAARASSTTPAGTTAWSRTTLWGSPSTRARSSSRTGCRGR